MQDIMKGENKGQKNQEIQVYTKNAFLKRKAFKYKFKYTITN